ncbi:phage conserved hypothetical protein, phiE125 gp8 family [Nitrosospira multiformis]|uniref:Phage gp6-like head-tail connector protein n=1 Tax=Nitrosospira multiformis TaxID=1231 RepID=A0A1H8IRF3_9PROT|nr:hypothetical protein [Nitrosospira multiformis]SEN70972.1 phage conserved hypothetical protein, phiE125 gp8 family [Nitrosospira multiformis]
MRVIEQPKIEPVSIGEVKAQIGADGSDDLIARRIIEARKWVEDYTGRALITQTREIRWDCFVDEHELPSALTVGSLKYIDPYGVETTLSTENYVLDTYSTIPYVRAVHDLGWPSTRRERNAVRIQYTAGYGPKANDVEPIIREAIILLVGHWMNHQPRIESGISISRIPFAITDLLSPYRLYFV